MNLEKYKKTETNEFSSKWHYIPDILTFSRIILGGLILIFIPLRINVLIFLLVYMIAWSSDVLDGKIARKMRIRGKWAEYDHVIDTFLHATSFIYVAFMGVVPLWLFLIWGGLWLILFLITRNKGVDAFFGTFAQVIFMILMYWYNELAFWLLAGFWVIILISGLISRRVFGRFKEFATEIKANNKEENADG